MTLLSTLLTAMDRVARPLVAATGAAPLISAYHPAMNPTLRQEKTIAVMANVVSQATKFSAAIIIERSQLLNGRPFNRRWLLVKFCDSASDVEGLRWQFVWERLRNFLLFLLSLTKYHKILYIYMLISLAMISLHCVPFFYLLNFFFSSESGFLLGLT